MSKKYEYLSRAVPVAPLKLIGLPGTEKLTEKINSYLVNSRKKLVREYPEKETIRGLLEDSFIIDCDLPRFGTGESKARLLQSARGVDLFILVDVCNPTITYKAFGEQTMMSPDDHFQNLKRVIAAVTGDRKSVV